MGLTIKMIDSRPKKRWGAINVKGQIQINDFIEDLYLPLDWWNATQYEEQWKKGLSRLKGHDTSCLIVAIHDPNTRPFIDWWKLYKVGNKIYIRNQLVFNEIYQELIGNNPLTLENCYSFIPPRGSIYDEDGNKLSEWVIDWNMGD
jgi:hypothetical protein